MSKIPIFLRSNQLSRTLQLLSRNSFHLISRQNVIFSYREL